MSNKFKYGVSFNCCLSGDYTVGGGEEGWKTIDYLGNDLEKLLKQLLNDNPTYKIRIGNDELLGRSCDMGGNVIAVLVEEDAEYAYTIAVVFEDPDSAPIIVE
jgi:hypothetical protein